MISESVVSLSLTKKRPDFRIVSPKNLRHRHLTTAVLKECIHTPFFAIFNKSTFVCNAITMSICVFNLLVTFVGSFINSFLTQQKNTQKAVE